MSCLALQPSHTTTHAPRTTHADTARPLSVPRPCFVVGAISVYDAAPGNCGYILHGQLQGWQLEDAQQGQQQPWHEQHKRGSRAGTWPGSNRSRIGR